MNTTLRHADKLRRALFLVPLIFGPACSAGLQGNDAGGGGDYGGADGTVPDRTPAPGDDGGGTDTGTSDGPGPKDATGTDGSADEAGPADATGTDGSSGTDSGSDGGSDATVNDAAPDSGGRSPDAGADASDGSFDAGEAGALVWAQNFGKTGQVGFEGVAIDQTNGDVVVSGYFKGSINFGGGTLISPGDGGTGSSAFVARFDSAGNYKWAKTYGDPSGVYAGRVGVDASGRIVLGGVFQGTINFGCSALSAIGDLDLFVAVLDSSGACAWSQNFGASGNTQNMTTATFDTSGNVLISGIAQGGVSFGGGSEAGYFIAKLTSGGVYSWSRSFAASCGTSTPSLAVDPQGNAVLGGCFVGSADFGAGSVASAGGGDAFVAKYRSSNGGYLWANHYTATVDAGNSGSYISGGGLAVDSAGHVFVLGSFGGQSGPSTIDFGGPPPLQSGATATIFIAKLDESGNGLAAKTFAASSPSDRLDPQTVAVGGAGGPIISAALCGTVDYGGGPLTSPNNGGCSSATMSFASFDAAGRFRWAYAEAPPSTSTATTGSSSLAAAGASLLVTGSFGPSGSTLVLPGKTLTAVSAQDLLLMSFVP